MPELRTGSCGGVDRIPVTPYTHCHEQVPGDHMSKEQAYTGRLYGDFVKRLFYTSGGQPHQHHQD